MFFQLTTLALVGSALASPVRRAGPSLKVTVETPSSVNTIEDLFAVTTLTNTGSEAIEVNPLSTAFHKSLTNDFVVDGSAASGDAKMASFVGYYAKYVTDISILRESGSLKTLGPGESITANISLAERYDLTASGAGLYTIAANPSFKVAAPGADAFQVVTAEVEPATVQVAGPLARARQTKRDITYNGCSADRQTLIQKAAANAQAGSQVALAHLKANGTDATYVKWFGAASTSRLADVTSHYTKMNGKYGNVKYDCAECENEEYVYAEVDPNDDTTIYLCGYYWKAPDCGVDSKQGTLIHESSHFKTIGSTQDYAYGQEDASNLARSNPARAAANADNHEYYEEDVYTACSP